MSPINRAQKAREPTRSSGIGEHEKKTASQGANAPFSPAVCLQERVAVNCGRGQQRPIRARGSNSLATSASTAAAPAILQRLERLGVGTRHLLDDSFRLLPVAHAPASLQGRAIGEGVVPDSCWSIFAFRVSEVLSILDWNVLLSMRCTCDLSRCIVLNSIEQRQTSDVAGQTENRKLHFCQESSGGMRVCSYGR